MPELTWTTALVWFGVLSGAASVGGLVLGLITWWQNRATTQLIAGGHAATQLTLKDVHAATQETLKAMHTASQDTMAQMDAGLKQVLDRMDARAEARYRDLRGRLDGEEEVPPA
jgi:hypothetical protein